MTDRLQELLDHLADDLAGGTSPPPLAATAVAMSPAASRDRVARHLLLPVAAAAAVLAVASVAFVLQQADTGVRTEFAGASPELGTIDATGLLQLRAFGPDQGDLGAPEGRADLLARVTTRTGDGVLFAQPLDDEQVCISFAYLPPATNNSGGLHCWREPDPAPFDREPITVVGQGPAGSPGGIKTPPVTYGAAPAGTRAVELSGGSRDSVQVPARDAGDAYGHRAYFTAPWDLTTGSTLLRALDGEGRELARLERASPAGANANLASMCQSNREALRGHFGRAAMVGQKWARDHPATFDRRRLTLPPQRPMTDAEAISRFDYARTQLANLGQEERYEHRLAANVVLIEGACFTDKKLQDAAKTFKQASG